MKGPAALVAATLLLVVVVLPACMAQGQDLPPPLEERTQFESVCDPADYGTTSGPAIPTLPRQFSLHIEANILNKERITWVHEFYDDVNNRGRLNFFNDGVREQAIFDYTNNEIFVFPDVRNGEECSVYPLAESRFINFTFGVTRVNGSIHIGSSRNFLEFLDDDTPVSFNGSTSTVRGVPALRWDACFSTDEVSMIASYYYNTENFSYPTVSDPSGSDRILSQMVVRGISFFNNTISNFYHVYSVYGFHSGPQSVPDSIFSVPTGLSCIGRIRGLPVPSAPQFFSSFTERVDPDRNSIAVNRVSSMFVSRNIRIVQ